ncbi:serine O-acetyltransferase EpsC [Caballeronia grimmiae]|uniref:serine O-acetyltransferase EpsC n=1 Tax=Caballeronia grimmiae TaxID=1071679 RepID=UPI0038BCA412
MPRDIAPDSLNDAPLHDSREWGLSRIVAELRESREELHRTRHPLGIRELPSRDAILKIVNGLRSALFPTHYGAPDLTDESVDYYVGQTLENTLRLLHEQIRRALRFLPEYRDTNDSQLNTLAFGIAREFGAQLPGIRALLVSDIKAAFTGDPAAQHITEILLCYPGVWAMTHHRLAHALHKLGVPLLARFINEIAHSLTGIDIHPGATIGPSFFIDHGTGVVIGETAVIGERVRVYQAVTLGAKSFPSGNDGVLVKGNARHPIVEDDVVIYAGATILGRVTIGKGSVIGGNVWLTHSVPPGSNVSQGKVREGAGADAPRNGVGGDNGHGA